jgi:hypothetical protein
MTTAILKAKALANSSWGIKKKKKREPSRGHRAFLLFMENLKNSKK